ncbi:MAG: heavy metal-binding domain-containing protein [Pseudomonadota bacterium]
MENLIPIAFWAILITLGFVFGRMAEAKHYASIHLREKQLLALPTTTSKHLIGEALPVARAELVTGSVVVSVDYFKRALGVLRGIVGGPVQAYETLIDRARREAVLRLKESCPDASQIINLRIETASITGGAKNTVGSVEVLASATAIYFVK